MQNPEMKPVKLSVFPVEEVGKRIRLVRRASGLSQAALAHALGVVQQSVSAWESGRSQMAIDTLWAFCRLTGVSADAVLGLTTDGRMEGILAAGALVHKIFDLVQQEATRISVEAPDVDSVLAAEADLGASPGPFGGPGTGRAYDEEDPEEGPYRCPVARCVHNANGDCKTNGIGCYL